MLGRGLRAVKPAITHAPPHPRIAPPMNAAGVAGASPFPPPDQRLAASTSSRPPNPTPPAPSAALPRLQCRQDTTRPRSGRRTGGVWRPGGAHLGGQTQGLRSRRPVGERPATSLAKSPDTSPKTLSLSYCQATRTRPGATAHSERCGELRIRIRCACWHWREGCRSLGDDLSPDSQDEVGNARSSGKRQRLRRGQRHLNLVKNGIQD